MTNAIVYVRCSTRGQANDGHSLQRQLRACLEHAEANGWGVRDIYCDAGRSGYEPEKLTQRNALLEKYGGRPDSIVIVETQDRWTRRPMIEDRVQLVEAVKYIDHEEASDIAAIYRAIMEADRRWDQR